MKVLFLDQSGELGGAELCLLDIVAQISCDPAGRDALESQVALLSAGPFQDRLTQANIDHVVLRERPPHPKDRAFFSRRLRELFSLCHCLGDLIQLARNSDLIYANTSKAMVMGAIAHLITGRPLVYHLHDILTPQHFLWLNRNLLVQLANSCATQVIANSHATQQAFIAAGGHMAKSQVIYNGFLPEQFRIEPAQQQALRQSLGGKLSDDETFTIGCFSRFAPWKGQHLLLESLAKLNDPQVRLLLVGDSLFGEEAYVLKLRKQVERLGLTEQVQFLGFRDDVPQLLALCDLLVHSPVAPEPFGRVIVEAMLGGKAIIAPAEGSSPELLRHGQTGWLIEPRSSESLALAIQTLKAEPELRLRMGQAAAQAAQQRFHLYQTNQAIFELLHHTLNPDLMVASPVTTGVP